MKHERIYDLGRSSKRHGQNPEELKSASFFVNEVVNEFYPNEGDEVAYHPPWQYAKGKILFRPHELSIWSGINGHGKSQVLGNIILQVMKEGARVCIASLEIKPKKLLLRLTRQASGKACPSTEHIQLIHEWYRNKLWVFDLVGSTKAERLLEVFLYAQKHYGIDFFVIDSFMKCGIDEEDFKSQKAFIEKLCDFKNQYPCQIHIVVHPRKLIDETHIPGKLDCKGTGAITDLADNCFSIWRNKKKEELMQKKENSALLTHDQLEKLHQVDAIWQCDKQRNGEWEGKIGLWFHKPSFQYLGNADYLPTCFVEYIK